MSESLRVSGKKFPLPKPAPVKFTVRPGGWVIAELPDGSRTRIAIAEARGTISASLGGKIYFGSVSSDRVSGGSANAGDNDLVAQFPGKVRKVLVADGAKVEEGAPLVLLEAMKMEFTVKAPFAGKVNRVCVKEGQQLSPGDRLVDLAAADAGGST